MTYRSARSTTTAVLVTSVLCLAMEHWSKKKKNSTKKRQRPPKGRPAWRGPGRAPTDAHTRCRRDAGAASAPAAVATPACARVCGLGPLSREFFFFSVYVVYVMAMLVSCLVFVLACLCLQRFNLAYACAHSLVARLCVRAFTSCYIHLASICVPCCWPAGGPQTRGPAARAIMAFAGYEDELYGWVAGRHGRCGVKGEAPACHVGWTSRKKKKKQGIKWEEREKREVGRKGRKEITAEQSHMKKRRRRMMSKKK